MNNSFSLRRFLVIEKKYANTNCISCGKETPVIFVIKDLTDYPLYRIPLCRQCSNSFAGDVIKTLKDKLEHSHELIGYKRKENITLKAKIKQMNKKSHNHKVQITKLYNLLNEAQEEINVL